MGQGGNVYEWNETAYDGTNDSPFELRYMRGGHWINDSFLLEASERERAGTTDEDQELTIGFRVASVPEPSSLSLLALGGVVVALRRRKK